MNLIIAVIVLIVVHKIFKYLYRKQFHIENSIVVITGSANGLGRKLCFEFAKKQCQIICIDINEPSNNETIQLIKKTYPQCNIKSFICDVSKYDQVKNVIQQILIEYKHVDILINNAGIIHCSEIEEYTETQIQNIMNINVLAHFWTTKEILPSMKERDYGCIVAISSLGGIIGVKHINPYCTSKFAVTGFMESLKNELRARKSKIRTLSVHPNFMCTQMVKSNMHNNRFFHVQDPSNVAHEIIVGIENGETRIFIPFYLWHLEKLGRLFPFIFHYLLDNILSIKKLVSPNYQENNNVL
ncbi:estradiol 17-beta-dehydrogenase 11-like, partial [Chrysoperla carnea]|uniref:estradiol 17-beta-dehydrogenase 11-like n=1 Tax=Chrysoperla carnea TaxID=189513 RepID=UPI001D068342